MGKQTDNIKKLLEAFPQLTQGEAKQYLEVHGSVEDSTSAILAEESKWSKVKTPAPKVEKKDKTSKHKTPAAVAAAAPRDASPRGDRPPREARAPRNDISEPVKKVAPKVPGTTLVEIGGGGAKVEKGLSFLDKIKMKKEEPVEVVAPAAPTAAPVADAPAAAKKGDKKKAPVEEEEVAHDPSQDPPAPTQSQAAAAAASPEVVAATTEEPVAKKERVKKPKAPKPAKVEVLYYVPQVESSETVSFPDHVLAHHIGESIKFTSIAGEAPAPPAPVQQHHVHQQHQMAGIHHQHQQHQQQPRYGGYNTAPHNAGYGSRVNNGAPRQHVSQWQQNPPPQQGQPQTWQQPTRAPRNDYQRPPTAQYRNDFRGSHDGQVDPAYNMRTTNNTWGN